MKKFSILLLGASLFFLIGCGKNKTQVSPNRINVQNYLDISYVSPNGIDLLSPDNTNSYNLSDFRLYYIKDGKQTLYCQGNLDSPYGFTMKTFIDENSGLYCFRLFFPSDSCYLHRSDGTVDTFKVDFSTSGNNWVEQKIWMNGEPVWPNSSNTRPYVIVHQ